VFTPEFVKKYSGKVLVAPGPAWYAGAIFNDPQSLNVPKGQLGVAPPPAWAGEQAVTGNVGGGTWFISSHSKNLKAAAKFAEFVMTAGDYQVNVAPGYPAFAAAAAKWIKKQESSGYYATLLQPIVTAGTEIWDGWGVRHLQPGGDLGQDGDSGHRRWQEPDRCPWRMGNRDQESGSGRRLHRCCRCWSSSCSPSGSWWPE
jgi:ABC-type glycerol-3-phosphate transport system substrate-binding protein